jgi:hypothetical protein
MKNLHKWSLTAISLSVLTWNTNGQNLEDKNALENTGTKLHTITYAGITDHTKVSPRDFFKSMNLKNPMQMIALLPPNIRPAFQETFTILPKIDKRVKSENGPQRTRILASLESKMNSIDPEKILGLVVEEKIGQLLASDLEPMLNDYGKLLNIYVSKVNAHDLYYGGNELLISLLCLCSDPDEAISQHIRLCNNRDSKFTSINLFERSIKAKVEKGKYYFTQAHYLDSTEEFLEALKLCKHFLGDSDKTTKLAKEWFTRSSSKLTVSLQAVVSK